ncbi:MAG: pyridoxamine 5'-phosphate oxidase family protein [Candidatus Paceibacterota bacterium]
MEQTQQREAALSFLTSNSIGALATVSTEGTPRVRLVYYATDPDFSIYFLSLENTRKTIDIRSNTKAAFVVSSNDSHHTLQIEGLFEEMTDTATFGPVIDSLTKHLFPENDISAPITHLDKSKPVFFKLSPTWIRWGDFSKGTTSEEVFFEL